MKDIDFSIVNIFNPSNEEKQDYGSFNIFTPLLNVNRDTLPELKPFSLGDNLQNQFSENNNDYSLSSWNPLHSFGKSDSDDFDNNQSKIERYEIFKPTLPISKENQKKEEEVKESITNYGDHFSNNCEANENDITNQNSREYSKSKRLRYIDIPLSSKEEEKESKKKMVIEKNNLSPNISNVKEIKNCKYKYKCEHPGCKKTFRTMKLKLNRHDLSNKECKSDTIALLYMIREVKRMVEKIGRRSKSKRLLLKKLYRKCLFNIPHKDYSISSLGNSFL